MQKLKIKNNFKVLLSRAFLILLFSSILLFSGVKIYQEITYNKTYEYKLLDHGYNKDDTKIILDNYKKEEILYILDQKINNRFIELVKDKYFIYDNFYTYLNYLEDNLDLNTRYIVEKINTYRNYDYYTNTIKTDITKNELMLVNKYHYLEPDYEPENLVTINMKYAWGEKGSHKITEDTYDAFKNMWEDAYENGFYLMISSSYRDYVKQEEIYNTYLENNAEEYADSFAAHPGFSEHQTGYVLDIFEKNSSNKETFHTSEAYQWLKDNSYKYGFILRYPQDKEDITGYSFESWHYRYIGIEGATYIHENDITFDEYYAYFIANNTKQ